VAVSGQVNPFDFDDVVRVAVPELTGGVLFGDGLCTLGFATQAAPVCFPDSPRLITAVLFGYGEGGHRKSSISIWYFQG
jgi:hypothetical protein